MTAETVSIVIVEDVPEFLRRFVQAFEGHPTYRVAAAVSDGHAGVEAVRRFKPDVLIVDLGLPGVSGIEVIRNAMQVRPDADALVVSVFGDEDHVVRSIEAGATGYLLKDSLPTQLIECVDDLRKGGSPISPSIARRLLTRFREPLLGQPLPSEAMPPAADNRPGLARPPLSEREHEILRLIAKGLSFNEVGDVLTISQHTVVTHVKRIYRKLAVHSRGEAVYEAGQMGLLS